MAFFRNFKKSFEELKSIRCLTVTAILIGVSVALKFVMIMPSETLKISFACVGLAAHEKNYNRDQQNCQCVFTFCRQEQRTANRC